MSDQTERTIEEMLLQPEPESDRYGQIGEEVLDAVRGQLYMNFPYMDVLLWALVPESAPHVTTGIATDGETLFYNGRWLADRYLRSGTAMNRAYMHTIFHCLLRHIGKAQGKDSILWDLACDTAVEALLQELGADFLSEGVVPLKRQFVAECAKEMKAVTAEGVYHRLLLLELDKTSLASLSKAFHVDDHQLWPASDQQQKEQRKRQDDAWKDRAEQTQTALSTMFSNAGAGGETVRQQIRVAVRDDVDYRAFLRRFAAPREVLQVDGDAFDYIYYTYGLSVYGNMPLVEPPETKEEKRIDDLVIAVDTSMSTSGALVKEFLACSYAILRSTETFTRKVNIHIIQCDSKVRTDDKITDVEELREYMEHFSLEGGSNTDFRPVFEHIDALQKAGEFSNLRGLIYFTDGMGIYPKARPSYETAFVLLEEPPMKIDMPAWAIRLTLELPDLARARAQAEEMEPDMIDWDELPRT